MTTLRDINIKLKNAIPETAPEVHIEPPKPVSKPVFLKDSRLGIRPQLKVEFFGLQRGMEPEFIFQAFLFEIPHRGDTFAIGDSVFEVKSVTRNLIALDQDKVREAVTSVLVSRVEPYQDESRSRGQFAATRQYQEKYPQGARRRP
jgi:hypothetical protein